MKKVKVICQNCGNEEVMEIMSTEEARQKNIPVFRITCTRCGSVNVHLRD